MSDALHEIASAAIAWDAIRIQAETYKEVRDEAAHALIADGHSPCYREGGARPLCPSCAELEQVHRDYRRAANLAGAYLRGLRRLIAKAQDH